METLPERTDLAVKIEAVDSVKDILSILKGYTQEQLADYIYYLKCVRAINRKDRLKLQILDQMDFTIWACDKDFNIRLWEGSCQSIYGKSEEQVIGTNYLEQFVSPLEQHQSKIDTLHILETGEKQACRYCDDEDSRGFPIQVITQCCRVYDDPVIGKDKGDALQAEMALNMNYERLVQESKIFIAKQEKEEQDIEQARSECRKVLEICKERVLKTADARANEFYNIATITASKNSHETSRKALNAVERLIIIRKEFNKFYLSNLRKLKTTGCTCDTCGKEESNPQKYTFANHSFNCVFRHNRPYLIKWQEDIESEEVKFQFRLSEVVLEQNEEESTED